MSSTSNLGNIRQLNFDPQGKSAPRDSKVIDYMKSSENYVGARFIFECGKKNKDIFLKILIINPRFFWQVPN